MKNHADEMTAQARAAFEKHHDAELRDFMLGAAQSLARAEAMYHQLGRLVTYTRASIAHQSRSEHLKDALQSAQRFLSSYEAAP